MLGQSFCSGQRSRRLIAGRQNYPVRFEAGRIRQADHGRIARGFDIEDLACEKLRRDWSQAARALQMMVHDGAQIVAINHAGNEAFAQFDFRRGIELRTSAQPV